MQLNMFEFVICAAAVEHKVTFNRCTLLFLQRADVDLSNKFAVMVTTNHLFLHNYTDNYIFI